MRVGRSRPPPPPPTLAVATGWLLSTLFAVLLALAHVIAASKITTTAKDFTAGDFMCAFLFLCLHNMPVVCLGGCDVGHRNHISAETNRWRQKVRSSANSPFDCTGYEADQSVVCTENQILQ